MECLSVDSYINIIYKLLESLNPEFAKIEVYIFKSYIILFCFLFMYISIIYSSNFVRFLVCAFFVFTKFKFCDYVNL